MKNIKYRAYKISQRLLTLEISGCAAQSFFPFLISSSWLGA